MSTPNQISFYDVKDIPENLLNYDYIESIEYNVFTEDLIVNYKSGRTKNLGSVSPDTIRDITGATIDVNGDLIIYTNTGNINAGRAVAEYTYSTGNVNGTGFLTDNNGTFKTVTSTDPNIVITDDTNGLNFNVSLGSLTSPAGTPVYSNFSWFRDNAEDFTTVANTWSKRNISQVVVNNLGLTNIDGRITLSRGAYLVKGYTKSFRSTTTYPAIRDAVNNVTLLQGMSQFNYNSADSTDAVMTIRGYLNIESTTDIELQMISLVGFSTLGGGVNSSFVADQLPLSNSELMIYKLSDDPFEPIIPENNEFDDLLFALQQNYYTSGRYSSSTVIRSNLGLTGMSGTNTYVGGCASDNKIFMVPYSANEIIQIDTITNVATKSNMGAGLSGMYKWNGGCLGPDGKIYCIPRDSTDILIIDPIAGTATRSNMGANLSGTSKWANGVLAPNGKIYGIPRDSPDVLIIDPITQTATRSNMGANLSGTSKWGSGILAPNGKIYCAPGSSLTFLIIDPINNTATISDMGLNIPSGGYSAQLAPNGKIYCIPRTANSFIIIDTITDTGVLSTLGISLPATTNKYIGQNLGPDGKIYCIPYNATNVLIINPMTDTATTTTYGSAPNGYWQGAVHGTNGKIYGVPHGASDFLIISNTYNLTYPTNLILSPYINNGL